MEKQHNHASAICLWILFVLLSFLLSMASGTNRANGEFVQRKEQLQQQADQQKQQLLKEDEGKRSNFAAKQKEVEVVKENIKQLSHNITVLKYEIQDKEHKLKDLQAEARTSSTILSKHDDDDENWKEVEQVVHHLTSNKKKQSIAIYVMAGAGLELCVIAWLVWQGLQFKWGCAELNAQIQRNRESRKPL